MNTKNAKVVTSKFLQLKEKLNINIRENKGLNNNLMRPVGVTEEKCNIAELQRAFGELCELLHELVVEEEYENQ